MDEELRISDCPEGDQVVLVMTRGGHALLVPRSVRNLTGPAEEVASELQKVVVETVRLRRQAEEMAVELRELGASWAAIGWLMGVSESRARQIVMDREEAP